MDVREFGFWVEEAGRADAERRLEAISASCAPYAEDLNARVKNLREQAMTPEERQSYWRGERKRAARELTGKDTDEL